MNVGAERNRAKRQRVPELRRDLIARSYLCAHHQTIGRENVTQFAIRIFNKRDPRGPIRVVLYCRHFGCAVALATFEIHFAIFLFMSAPNVARSESAVVIAAAASFLRLDKILLWLRLRDLVKRRNRLESQRRCKWTKISESHSQKFVA